MRAAVDDQDHDLDRYIRAVASLDGASAFTSLDGTLLGVQPGGLAQPLLGCTGFRVVRAEVTDAGWNLRAREVLLFTDLATGTVIDSWRNPISGRSVDVLHDWLDPVCSVVTAQAVSPARRVGDQIVFESSTTETVVNPLRLHVFTREAGQEMLRRSEHTTVAVEDWAGGSCIGVSSVRFTPWLPWMLLAQTEGSLVSHLTGKRVEGFDALSEVVRARVSAERPEFAFAPNTWTDRRESSWSLYLAERQPVQ